MHKQINCPSCSSLQPESGSAGAQVGRHHRRRELVTIGGTPGAGRSSHVDLPNHTAGLSLTDARKLERTPLCDKTWGWVNRLPPKTRPVANRSPDDSAARAQDQLTLNKAQPSPLHSLLRSPEDLLDTFSVKRKGTDKQPWVGYIYEST